MFEHGSEVIKLQNGSEVLKLPRGIKGHQGKRGLMGAYVCLRFLKIKKSNMETSFFQLTTMNSICTEIYSFFSRLVYINLFLRTYNKNIPIIVVIEFPSFEILRKITEYGNRLINRAKQTKI